MADSTLAAIRTKVRRLTRSPSVSQLSNTELDEYVNTFVLYDFPEHLRQFALRTTLTFYTEPYTDVYETDTVDPTSPLYNFKNRYITVHPPVYVAGFEVLFSQSREQFYGIYPQVNSIASIGVAGDGVTTAFSGTLSAIPLLKNNVLFSSVNTANAGLELHDDGAGTLSGDGTGTINYVTGAFTLNFSSAPASGVAINSQTIPYVAALPNAVLYYDSKFTVRPVPDQPYRVQMDVYVRPTELLNSSQSPDLEEWWQYIAYGAAKKVFEDRMDMESVSLIMPEFKKQEALVLRRTIVQQTNERVATIYTEQIGLGSGWGGNGPF